MVAHVSNSSTKDAEAEGCHELEVSQEHTSPRRIWATVEDPVSSKQRERRKKENKK